MFHARYFHILRDKKMDSVCDLEVISPPKASNNSNYVMLSHIVLGKPSITAALPSPRGVQNRVANTQRYLSVSYFWYNVQITIDSLITISITVHALGSITSHLNYPTATCDPVNMFLRKQKKHQVTESIVCKLPDCKKKHNKETCMPPP